MAKRKGNLVEEAVLVKALRKSNMENIQNVKEQAKIIKSMKQRMKDLERRVENLCYAGASAEETAKKDHTRIRDLERDLHEAALIVKKYRDYAWSIRAIKERTKERDDIRDELNGWTHDIFELIRKYGPIVNFMEEEGGP
jgi:predicted RNase H-like nuclease (RuvC/YqgF family)